jgi:type VI secretion system ImpB/VipA family protein
MVMAKASTLRVGAINLTAGAVTGEVPERPREETPFRILVLGDFSGQGRSAEQPVAQRKLRRVDRDNLEEVLAALAPSVNVPRGPSPQEREAITFRELEDFEPHRLIERLRLFQSLGELRERLQDPARFAAAAAEIQGWGAAPDRPAPPVPESQGHDSAPVSPENLLDQMLGETESPRSLKAAGLSGQPFGSEWDCFLKDIVRPYQVARADPRLADYEALLDEAISAQLRTILHHADFQALEATWRGLDFLVRRLETDETLQIHLLDVTRAELAADLLNVDDLSTTGTYRHLVDRTMGTAQGQPWAVLVSLYTFGPGQQELELLANLARIASAVGAPFLAAADSRFLGCPSLASSTEPADWRMDDEAQQAWGELRARPEAAFLGLTLPRLLLRLPYRQDARPAEGLAFEELPAGSSHESYLWGNPALAGALLLGQAFTQSGWDLHPGELLDITELPVHIYEEEGERQAKPCAEVLLSDRAVEHILEMGLMPLVSASGRPAARLARFQSIATPSAPLSGRWQ